jgi:xylitol oxidase
MDGALSGGYSVSLFTEWRGDQRFQVWVKERISPCLAAVPRDYFGAAAVHVDRHPLPGLSAEHCTQQRSVPGPWHERLPHFRMGFTPSGGEELQSEYFVARRDGAAALRAVGALHERIHPLLLISEIRAVAADRLWMSPFYQRDALAIHFTWKRDWARVSEVLPLIEKALWPFRPRPHWGKLFTMSPLDVEGAYPRQKDFRDLVQAHDPQGKFRNPFLETYALRP